MNARKAWSTGDTSIARSTGNTGIARSGCKSGTWNTENTCTGIAKGGANLAGDCSMRNTSRTGGICGGSDTRNNDTIGTDMRCTGAGNVCDTSSTWDARDAGSASNTGNASTAKGNGVTVGINTPTGSRSHAARGSRIVDAARKSAGNHAADESGVDALRKVGRFGHAVCNACRDTARDAATDTAGHAVGNACGESAGWVETRHSTVTCRVGDRSVGTGHAVDARDAETESSARAGSRTRARASTRTSASAETGTSADAKTRAIAGTCIRTNTSSKTRTITGARSGANTWTCARTEICTSPGTETGTRTRTEARTSTWPVTRTKTRAKTWTETGTEARPSAGTEITMTCETRTGAEASLEHPCLNRANFILFVERRQDRRRCREVVVLAVCVPVAANCPCAVENL
jgi:hypothetical protein